MPTYTELNNIVREASELALELYRSEVNARHKEDGSWVTDADEAVEDLLVRRFQTRFPEIAILAEERASRGIAGASDAAMTVAIDPIDGTASFVGEMPFWCVSVGLMAGPLPWQGVVSLPAIGTHFGTDGRVLWCDGMEHDPPTSVPIDRHSVLLVPSHTHRRFDLTRFVGKTRSYGSTAHHLALVASGSATAALCTRGTRLWDIAAGLALGASVGMEARHIDGAPLDTAALLDGRGAPAPFLVTRPDRHAELASAIRVRAPSKP